MPAVPLCLCCVLGLNSYSYWICRAHRARHVIRLRIKVVLAGDRGVGPPNPQGPWTATPVNVAVLGYAYVLAVPTFAACHQ